VSDPEVMIVERVAPVAGFGLRQPLLDHPAVEAVVT
jgi:hypothetical protein